MESLQQYAAGQQAAALPPTQQDTATTFGRK
jgi:hypothetical protein